MSSIVRGPAAAALLVAGLAAIARGHADLTRVPGGGLGVLAGLAALGLVAALLFQLAMALTDNRVVSLGGTLLLCLHPLTSEQILTFHGRLDLVALALALSALARHRFAVLKGHLRPRELWLGGAMVFAAGLCGQAALLAPVAGFLIEALWPPRPFARRRAQIFFAATLPGGLLGVWLGLDLRAGVSLERIQDRAAAWSGRLGLPTSELFGIAVIGSALAMGLLGLWFVRRAWRTGRTPHGASQLTLALGVFAAFAALGLVAEQPSWAATLAFWPLVAAAFVWRMLLVAMPAPVPRPDEPPFDIHAFARSAEASARRAANGPRASEQPFDAQAVREVVLQTMMAALPKAEPAPGGALDLRLELAARRAEQRLQRALPLAWRSQELEATLYRSYVRPWVSQDVRVLELDPRSDRMRLALLADAAQVCVLGPTVVADAAIAEPSDRLSFVRGSMTPRWPLRAASFELVIAEGPFLRWSPPQALAALREIRRVLRPGGRAIISIACLEAPRALQQLEAESLGLVPPLDPPLQWLGQDALRGMAQTAGLAIIALHVGALDRDSLVILDRPIA